MEKVQNLAKNLQYSFFLELTIFLNRNRERWPHWVIYTAIASAAIVVSGLWLAIFSPYAGEVFQNWMINTFLSGLTIAALFFGFVIARGFYRSCQEVAKDMPVGIGPIERVVLLLGVKIERGPRLLAWTEPALGSDLLICTRPGEAPEDYERRLDEAILKAGPGRVVVALAKGRPSGLIYGGQAAVETFKRTSPPFQGDDWTEEQRIVPANARFLNETDAEFQEYVNRFAMHFPEWSEMNKVSGNKAAFAFRQIVKLSALFLLLFFAVPSFAQKAAQVAKTPIANQVPPDGNKIVFMFASSDLMRNSDGKRTYAQLLKAAPNYRDGGGGSLLAITLSGSPVYKADQTQEIAETSDKNQQMRKASTPETMDAPLTTGFSLPDSTEAAEAVERVGNTISFYKTEFWKGVKPYWALGMVFFWALFPILLAIGGILWFWCDLSAGEEMPRIHWYASKGLVVLVGFAGSVLILNLILTVIYNEPTIFWLTFWVVLIVFVAAKVARWIVPNIKAKANGRTAFYRPSNNNPPLLG